MDETNETRAVAGTAPLPAFLIGTLKAMVAFVIFAMMALIFVDVALRKLFSAPIPGGFEIVQFMLAFLIFNTLPLITWAEGHIVVSIFESFFTGRRGRIQRIGVMLASAAVLVLIAFLMWRQAASLQASQQITGFLNWPIYPIAYVMCAFSVVAVFVQVAMLWHCLRREPGAGTAG